MRFRRAQQARCLAHRMSSDGNSGQPVQAPTQPMEVPGQAKPLLPERRCPGVLPPTEVDVRQFTQDYSRAVAMTLTSEECKRLLKLALGDLVVSGEECLPAEVPPGEGGPGRVAQASA